MSRTQPVIYLLAVTVCFLLSTTALAQPASLTPSGWPQSDGLSVVYDPATGGIQVTPPSGTALTALELRSESRSFTGTCENLGGIFDVCTDAKVFKLATAGFETVDFGSVLSPGLSGDMILDDMLVDGASLGGEFVTGSGMFLVHPDFVPEPSSWCLLALGAVLAGIGRRRRPSDL